MRFAGGMKLDGYEILALLGAGGMGEVYRARDPALKREVAIKVLRSNVSLDPDRLRRFQQEAQATAALDHSNILAVHQFGVFQGSPYLVSELLVGQSLRQVLQHGPIPVRKGLDYAVQIAHGLAAAHEKGVVHRDLKPENLFLTKEGCIKILDFGLAKVMQPQSDLDSNAPTLTLGTNPGVVMGTAGYMSPEQVRGQSADHRTDIFSFGALLYEILTSRRAFQRSTSAETMAAILNDEPSGVSQTVTNIPPALQRLVNRCLEKNPEQRFHAASDLAFALEALSDSGSGPPVTGPPSHRPTRTKVMWSIALIAVSLLAGVAWLEFANRKAGPPLRISGYNKLVFYASSSEGPHAWTVRSTGGSPQRLLPEDRGPETEPSWSPDGRTILFSTGDIGGHDSHISTLDLASHQIGTLPGSDGMFAPRWSPDGQFINAASLDSSTIYVFALKTQHWSALTTGPHAYAQWSSDSRSIYFLRYATEPAILRIPAAGGEAKLVVSLKHSPYIGTNGPWFGLDPTDAPLMLRDASTTDVYALTLADK
jgi:serine/threonine protein kinase